MNKIYLIILILLLVGFCQVGKYTSIETVTVTVTDKERVSDGESSKYLIFTDLETFECVDELLIGKFNSSDFYGKIKRDQQYTFKVRGWRMPFFSSYRNIIEIDNIKEKEDKPKDIYSTWYLKDSIKK